MCGVIDLKKNGIRDLSNSRSQWVVTAAPTISGAYPVTTDRLYHYATLIRRRRSY
jgi:hypothetical protein